uniref:Uncharacterized protein n=1 Tax=Yersinia enterocolitica W22703 TaxID=913028 RepID=F4MXJ8_YEREN|nr:unknown protein [Yersinia enterocolitica W22703]
MEWHSRIGKEGILMIRFTKAIGCAAFFLNIYAHACSCFSITKLVISGIFFF